jgi:hypothetical protein
VPTYEPSRRFFREFDRLSAAQQARFMGAVDQLVEALRTSPPEFPAGLRVKRVLGTEEIWELTWAPDGRATFSYGGEQIAGDPHVIWRRVGDHSIFRNP